MKRLPILILFLLISFPSLSADNSAEENLPSKESRFVQFVAGTEEWQAELQTAIVSFRNSAGVQINLVAAVHIGEVEYYKRLNKFFETQDVVLYELVAEANEIPVRNRLNTSTSVIGFIQQSLAKFLNVSFQLNQINYAVENFLHADLTSEQLAELMASKNENFFTMFSSLAMAQMAEQQRLPSSESRSSFNLSSLTNALKAENRNNAFKYLLAEELGRSGGIIAAPELAQQLTLLGDRNKAALRVLEETLQNTDFQQISLFYGAAHMPAIEREISGKLGFERTDQSWEAAWVIP